jgi:putative FmdB family regulatory protein
MPTYEYRCGACGTATEIFHSMTEAPKRKCPSCGKPKLERQISAGAGILFKGTGFYQTDYRSDAYKSAASADSSAGKPVDTKPSGGDGDAKSTSAKSETPAPKSEPEKKSSKRKKSD